MNPRVLPAALLLLAALAAGGEPERDPFLAALAGRSGPGAVEAPDFDAEAEAFSWTLRPRREIVDGLAARLLRGEAKGWTVAAKAPPELPAPPSRIPADFEPAGVPVTDRLAAWVPADAAALLLPSLREGEDLVRGMAEFLPRALPVLCDDPPGGSREALRRATERLLLPVVWGANPNVRTGTRQVAVVAADPDLRWGADVAFVAEVDDASLVLFHRRSSLRWEDRGTRVLRIDGLDAVSDDGSIRSFFGMAGGVAVWATTKDLRDRILAAGEGRTDSLLRPDPRAWALARRTFPAAEGGALLVVPDGFLARADSAAVRAKRAAALRCEAARLLLDARSLAGKKVSHKDTLVLACPAGGVLRPVAGRAGSSCSLHGTAADPVPLGDLPGAGVVEADAGFHVPPLDMAGSGALPPAVRYGPVPGGGSPWTAGNDRSPECVRDGCEVLVPPGTPGKVFLETLRPPLPDGDPALMQVARAFGEEDPAARQAVVVPSLTGLIPGVRATGGFRGRVVALPSRLAPIPERPRGGVLRLALEGRAMGGTAAGEPFCRIWSLIPEWR